MPISPPNLIVFRPKDVQDIDSNHARHVSGISVGPDAADAAFRFNIYSAYVGCHSKRQNGCTLSATGYVWDTAIGQEKFVVQMEFTLEPCHLDSGCSLRYVEFEGFRDLTGIKFNVAVDGIAQALYMDNLEVGRPDERCKDEQGRL